jgi:hypothetical protein
LALDTKSEGFIWQAFLIFAACAFTPLMVWVGNPESPAFLTSAVVIVVLTALGLVVRTLAVRFGADPMGITYSIAILLFFFLSAGVLVLSVLGGRSAAFGIALLVSGIAYRLRAMGIFRILVAWAAFFLLVVPVLSYIGRSAPGEGSVEANSRIHIQSIESDHDVVVIVLDGYPSDGVLREFHHFDNSEFTSRLEAMGFAVDRNARSNFPATVLSVANTLNLDYVVAEQHLTRADFEVLYEMLGGNNTLARILTENGYSQTYVESGWLGTRCRSLVDDCVAMPWPDETIYDITLRSLLRGLDGFEVGQSFGRGASHSLRWLENDLNEYLENDVPDYVYVHVLAPHPPFFLTPTCDMVPSKVLSGFTTSAPGLSQDEIDLRSEGYQDQVRCVNHVLASVAEAAVANDAIVVMFGDHGSDIGGQLHLDGSEWTDAHIRERFGPFLAGYGPGCDFQDVGSLVNVSRRIIACLSSEELADLPVRAFLPSKDWDLTEIDLALSVDH